MMSPTNSAVRNCIIGSYLERREQLPSWLAHQIIFHLGLRERMQQEQVFLRAAQRRARRSQRRR